MPRRISSRRALQRKEKILYAQRLRKRSTNAERILWNVLRNRQCGGIKFRRQVPFGAFIADFCSMNPRLIIEIDGEIHVKTREYDSMREHILRERGFHIVRFTNHQVVHQLSVCLLKIAKIAARLRIEQSEPRH